MVMPAGSADGVKDYTTMTPSRMRMMTTTRTMTMGLRKTGLSIGSGDGRRVPVRAALLG
jgi:hypothetical protein